MKNIKLKSLLKEDKPKKAKAIYVAKRDVKIPGFGPIKKGEPVTIIEKLKADDDENTSGYDEYVIMDAFEIYADNYYIPVDVFKNTFETLDKNKHSKTYKELLSQNIIKEEKLQYKLDNNFISKVKPALLSLWNEIGHDISDTTNKNVEAIEALIDQLSSHIDGKDSKIRKEAEKILTQVLSNYGYDKGLKFIAQNINLI